MLIGVIIFLMGAVTGMLVRQGMIEAGRDRSPKSPQPICGCKHHFSSHDPETKACNVETVKYYANIYEVSRLRCPCLQYTGPEPLPTYYAPEITGE